MANPFAPKAANPFAAPAPAAANPFAAPAPAANPFAAAAPAANPFAAAAPAPAAANPFAAPAASANPFAPKAANPFAAPAPAAANPFAAPAASANPFAKPAGANPFAPAATTNPFAAAGAAGPFAQQAVAPPPPTSNPLVTELKRLEEAYAPTTETYKLVFRAVAYNVKEPGRQYAMPPGFTAKQWEAALKDAPDPRGSRVRPSYLESADGPLVDMPGLVPVALIGFDNLQHRVILQDKNTAEFLQYGKELMASIAATERATTATQAKLMKLRREHRKLSHRLIGVMEKVDRALAMDKPLDRNEVQLRNRLQAILDRLNRPTEFRARLNELVSLQHLQEGRGRQQEVLGEDDLRQIAVRLEAQREGLEHLNRVVATAARDLGIMQRAHKPAESHKHTSQAVVGFQSPVRGW